jgi:O-antigen/teichoic acid export membrane protein
LIPWIIYSIGSFAYFFSNAVLSFLEGLNKIAKIQRIRLISAISNTVIVALCLICELNIFALAFSVFFSSFVLIFNIVYSFHKTLLQLIRESSGFNYDWKVEILPLFIRYALSFASGYFIFQIYTPLMHYFHGPVYSGKVGITLNLVTTAFNLSGIWTYTIIPRINIVISKKEWPELDRIFYNRLLFSLLSYIIIVFCFYITIYFFKDFWIIPKIIPRFLDNISIIILFTCYFIQQIINSLALYLRGHKKEPFVIPSIVSAIWTLMFTLIIGNFLPPSFFFLGLLSSYAWGLPLALILFYSFKKKWHSLGV